MSRATFPTYTRKTGRRFASPASIPFRVALIAFLSGAALLATGCSSGAKKESQTFPAGEKVTVGPLVYNVVDNQILTQLGDDATTARTPRNRFYVMAISVSNSSSEDEPIPGLTLVDDAGKEYPEAADGTNVPNWLGVVRKVGGAQTEHGNILFDAPAQHYRLRLTDEADAREFSIDVPLTYVNEQLKQVPTTSQPENQPIVIPQKN
jgi:hypothetical protein